MHAIDESRPTGAAVRFIGEDLQQVNMQNPAGFHE
jgi:hypothetical protein